MGPLRRFAGWTCFRVPVAVLKPHSALPYRSIVPYSSFDPRVQPLSGLITLSDIHGLRVVMLVSPPHAGLYATQS